MSKQGYCKYCGKLSKLLKSHIVPRFLYTDSNNSKKMIALNAKEKKESFYQAGVWDNILCEDCERLMAIYDKEFFNFTKLDFSKFIYQQSKDGLIYKIPSDNYNFKNLRKFFISMLWRGSISTKSEFSMINLGKYEKIALDILKDKYDDSQLFATFLFKEPSCKLSKDLHFVEQTKYENQIAYRIYFGGFQINTVINTKTLRSDKNIFELVCNNNEYIPILESKEILDYKINHIVDYYRYYKSISVK